jgi:trehalose 6-phosphate synthase
MRPVSGLLSAVEPLIESHGGTWIAQSCGNADLEVVRLHGDPLGQVKVDSGAYWLRRIFLTQNEVEGHTDGFSNQALWPLCHLAYQKPLFLRHHWSLYQQVNTRFASAVRADELASNTQILIQDYHLALVPKKLRERIAPEQNSSLQSRRAPIAFFWHIPWPPAELVERCPWIREILEGMLGADLIAFHTPEHCNHFMETCRRILGSQIDPLESAVHHEGRKVRVRSVPVAIAPRHFEPLPWQGKAQFWQDRFGIQSPQILLAVDRIDPTKGVLERLEAYRLLLTGHPELRGKVTLVQVAPPCRGNIKTYQDLAIEVHQRFEALKREFGTPHWPAALLIQHALDWNQLAQLYQMADLCIVSPLHDGMNLVSKEYVWCQHHEQGGLLLSRFAGASHELRNGAWLVNPADTESFARSIRQALQTPANEKRARMQLLRKQVLGRTAVDWGKELLQELSQTSSPQAQG